MESIFNCAAMGLARFLIYPWFIFFYVGDQTQTSLDQIVFGTLNHATCDVYLLKAAETLIQGKCCGYWLLYCV